VIVLARHNFFLADSGFIQLKNSSVLLHVMCTQGAEFILFGFYYFSRKDISMFSIIESYHVSIKICLLTALLVGLQGCGGGGDKKSTNSSLSSTSAVSSVASSVGVSSSLASSLQSSSVAMVATHLSGAVSLQDMDGDFIEIVEPESISVQLSLVNDGQTTLTAAVVGLVDIETSSMQSLPFSTDLEAVGARYLVVKISKPGYTDYARRFDVQDEITINATLTELPAEEIEPTSVQTISGEAVSGFNFSIVTTEDGQQIQAGATESIPALSVSIPESALPEGTEFIDVAMQAFNPNDEKDAAYFPGAYEDSTGNKLLSVAFNYTDVTTSGGVSLQKIAMETRQKRLAAEKRGISFQKFAEASEPIIINRAVPLESCSALSQLGDAHPGMGGFQVPVYTYNPNSGVWDLLGYGTLYTEEGELIESTFSDFNCEEMTYVLEIKVTNEIFLSNWWNLDYPLVFEEPVKLCATIALKNEQGLPAVGRVLYVSDDDANRSFSAETFVTDENGMAHIEVYSLSNELDTSAALTIYTQDYSQPIRKTFSLSTNCANTTPVEVQVELPAMCKLEGKLTTMDGQPLSDEIVFAWGEETDDDAWAMPAYGATNENGQYLFSVNCDVNYNFVDYLSWITSLYTIDEHEQPIKHFNVNNALANDEKTDDGDTVVLNDIAVEHNKPFAFVANDELTNTLDLTFLYAGDHYPLTYDFDVVDTQTEEVIKHFTGTISADDVEQQADESGFAFDIGFITITHNIPVPDSFAIYTVRGTIADTENHEGSVSGYVFIEGAE